jgi:hypothetical protein
MRSTARIRAVIKPIHRAKRVATIEREHLLAFQRRSLREKIDSLREGSGQYLRRAGYKVAVLNSDQAYEGLFPGAGHNLRGAVVGQKHEDGVHSVVFVDAINSLTKAASELYRNRLIRLPLYEILFQRPEPAPQRVEEDFFIWSLNRHGIRRLGEVLPGFAPGELPNTLHRDTTQHILVDGNRCEVPRSATFHVFDSPSQFIHLEEELAAHLS